MSRQTEEKSAQDTVLLRNSLGCRRTGPAGKHRRWSQKNAVPITDSDPILSRRHETPPSAAHNHYQRQVRNLAGGKHTCCHLGQSAPCVGFPLVDFCEPHCAMHLLAIQASCSAGRSPQKALPLAEAIEIHNGHDRLPTAI